MQCISVRKIGSKEPCHAKPLRGHTLCGRHARMTTPVLWTDAIQPHTQGVKKIQSLARGWLIRHRIRLGGPGVLKRKDLANDEELITCVEKEKQHPFDYFAFDENGKIWWFDFDSIWKWAILSEEPLNPYTKVPLSVDTRRRLRAVWGYRLRNRIPMPEESLFSEERLRNRWNSMVQLFSEYGFDVHTRSFMHFDVDDYISMFILLRKDVEVVFPESDPARARALRLCMRGQSPQHPYETTVVKSRATYLLMFLLSLHKNPYAMSFSILSALYRC